jgi:hypothetical protein
MLCGAVVLNATQTFPKKHGLSNVRTDRSGKAVCFGGEAVSSPACKVSAKNGFFLVTFSQLLEKK